MRRTLPKSAHPSRPVMRVRSEIGASSDGGCVDMRRVGAEVRAAGIAKMADAAVEGQTGSAAEASARESLALATAASSDLASTRPDLAWKLARMMSTEEVRVRAEQEAVQLAVPRGQHSCHRVPDRLTESWR